MSIPESHRLVPIDPDTAKFLTPEERAWVIGRLPSSSSRSLDATFSKSEFRKESTSIINYTFAVTLMLFVSEFSFCELRIYER